MSEIKLKINGKQLTGTSGETILQIALKNGIEIPNLCYAQNLKTYGACGMCVVEAEGSPKLLRACSTLAKDGMVIDTENLVTVMWANEQFDPTHPDTFGENV